MSRFVQSNLMLLYKKNRVKEFGILADNKFVGQTNPLPPIVCPTA